MHITFIAIYHLHWLTWTHSVGRIDEIEQNLSFYDVLLSLYSIIIV